MCIKNEGLGMGFLIATEKGPVFEGFSLILQFPHHIYKKKWLRWLG